MHKLLVFETHPVQYHAPVYCEISRLRPGQVEVIYASDCSMRGCYDSGFRHTFAWDTPLLDGYTYRILHNRTGDPSQEVRSFSGRGVLQVLNQERPKAVLLTQFRYAFDWAAFLGAISLGIPVWVRQETQDEAFVRGRLKGTLRWFCYWIIYSFVKRAFYVGELNRQHLVRHRMKPAQLLPARYCTVDRLAGVGPEAKAKRRLATKAKLGIESERIVLAFFGKLIPKKDPFLLLEAIQHVNPALRDRLAIVFVGAGQLDKSLQSKARLLYVTLKVPCVFTGFVNQSPLVDYYLAADVAILPSLRRGETWGLVVNEALQAGCAVIMSDAVGCAAEFGSWERCRVIPVGDAARAARAIEELSQYTRSFDWCTPLLAEYSVETAARAIVSLIP